MISRAPKQNEADERIVEAIQQLLADNVPKRTIARQLTRRFGRPVGKNLVYLIADGRHVTQTSGARFIRHTCGHLVVLPCRICAARQAQSGALAQ